MFDFSPTVKLRLECLAENLLGEAVMRSRDLAAVGFSKRAARAFSRFAPVMRLAMVAALWFVEYEAWLRTLTRFTRLSAAAQGAYFHRRFNPPRSAFRIYLLRLLQTFIVGLYYADPEVARALGYPERDGWVADRRVTASGGSGVHPGPDEDPLQSGILPHPCGDLSFETDVLVIGSGAGGAVVAAELAECGRRVLILEEGGSFRTVDFKTGNSHDRYLSLYRDGGMTAALGLPLVLIPLGKTVGGTTTINSGTCLRCPDAVFDGWRERFGLAGLTPQVIAPYYERVEDALGVVPVPAVLQGGNFHRIDRGIRALGLAGGPLPRNAPGCVASGECCFGCPSGAKLSMDQSYVPRALKAGARMFTHCRAERLRLSSHRVNGVTARFTDPATGRKTARLTVNAKQVVVACGTLLTPVLLKRSGVVSSRALGRHMTVHPTAKAVGIFADKLSGHRGVPQGYHTEFLHGRGLMFESIFYPPWLMAVNYGGVGEDHRRFMQSYQHAGVFAFLISDDANGRVVAMPDGRPLLLYSFGRREHELYLEGTRWLGKILFAAGATKVFTGVHSLPVVENAAELERLTPDRVHRHELETVAFHPLGTCRMGFYPHESVVDAHLRVHDYDNLFIADGSIFPSSLGVNPQMTIMAFASRLGQSLC